MRRYFSLGLVLLLTAQVWADGGAPTMRVLHPEDNKYAALAAYYQKEGLKFDQIFSVLCKMALSNADNDPKLTLSDQVRSLFGGLWLWSQNGGNSVLQSRVDWAWHFIGGGTFEGYWDVGRSAAVIKERVDSHDPSNWFDLDDMAATMLGARWMNLATDKDPGRARRWVELWASGQWTINRSLPKLQFGQMPQGKEASAQAVESVRQAMDKALTLPGTDAPTNRQVASPPKN